MSYYLKFQVPYKQIQEILQKNNYKRIIFFVDLPSISRGFYNKGTVHAEIDAYLETKKTPTLYIDEMKQFFNTLYKHFNNYSPKFIIAYDDGRCLQNVAIEPGYKSNRISAQDNLILEDNELQLFYKIKEYYYSEIEKQFNISNLSYVYYLRNFEADFTPYFFLMENLLDSASSDCLNVILSTDKDLLQTCAFNNVIQCATIYSRKESKLIFNIFDTHNAIQYIYKNFKRGILTSEYIPLILSMSKDSADNIDGIPNVGPSTAIKLIIKHKLPPKIYPPTILPLELEPYRKLIIKNLKLISFEEQILRLPLEFRQELRRRVL